VGASDYTAKKVNACLYIDKQVLETAKQAGLNISKVSENALIGAIEWLRCPEPETSFRSQTSSGGRGRDLNPFASLAVTCRLCEEIVPRNHQIRAKLKQTELWLSCNFGFDVGFSIRE